ncbi:bifunctional DNA primase/polymerase [Thermodesulfobacteriota bacterium]
MTISISEVAIKYSQAGLSLIPVNGDKRPVIKEWTSYQKEIAKPEQIREWFKNGKGNVAAIAGKVSGNLEILDFDLEAEAFKQWAENVQERDSGLLNKVIIERSPHGAHVAYRCPEMTIPGNTKLARKSIEGPGPGEREYRGKTFQAQAHNGKYFINPELIETRGEGGYCLVYPSKGYELKQGDFCSVSVITAAERDILIESARACNEWIPPQDIEQGYHDIKARSGEKLPGQDFDERGDVQDLLKRHGWQSRGAAPDGREKWVRPGKDKGYSATLTDGKIFYCFSSNGHPFETGKGYGPFGVYTMLEHGGDFKKATKALSKQGYGTKREYNPKTYQTAISTPPMADLREYIDLCVTPGQKITVDEICRGLSCYKREDRKIVYVYIGRLCKEGILKKDDYRHGGYRRVIEVDEYDLSGTIGENEILFDVKLPLDLDNLLKIKPDQIIQISGRYDAAKSTTAWNIVADNYQEHKIIIIVSDEWSLNAIKEIHDTLRIPRPHPNIKVVPMKPGYEDMIPSGPCIVLIDYIRADQNPYETDAQIQRILKNLNGGIAIFATQKHPGLDRPVGGQFAVHASHHIIMLDKWKDIFTCKIFRTKSEKNLEGYFRTFRLNENRRLVPCMDDWKQGGIKWEKEQNPKDNNDHRDNNDNNYSVSKGGGPLIYKGKKKEERTKEERKKEWVADPNPPGSHKPFGKIPIKTSEHLEGEIPREGIAF